MRRALSVIWFSIRAVYDELLVLAGIGGIWLAMSLLIPLGVLWLTRSLPVSVITILLNLGSFALMPPCTAAVFEVAVSIAREKRIEFGYFWQGFKAHWKTSYKIAGILFISGAVLVFNALFYLDHAQNTLFLVLGISVLWGLLFWLCVQIYLWPLGTQKEKRTMPMVQGAGLLTLAFPIFALVIMIAIALVTALSIVLPALLPLWMPFVAVLSSRAFESSSHQVDTLKKMWHERDAVETLPRNK